MWLSQSIGGSQMILVSAPVRLVLTQIFFWQTSKGDHSEPFLFFDFFSGTPPSCLKVRGGVGASVYVVGASVYVVAHKILVSAPVPFWGNWGWNWVGLGWERVWGDRGLRGWGLGLDIYQ